MRPLKYITIFHKKIQERNNRLKNITYKNVPLTDEILFKQEQNIRRNIPYFIQIGFDFGTAFSKCIYRDVNLDKAYIYLNSENPDVPFLIPSTLFSQEDKLYSSDDLSVVYNQGSLNHLKLALVKIAHEEWDDRVLISYKKILNSFNKSAITSKDKLREFVINCGIYYLAKNLGNIRKQIKTKYHNFGEHPKDYIAVNLSVPVTYNRQGDIEDLFIKLLKRAWLLTDQIVEIPKISYQDLNYLILHFDQDSNGEACFIFPEVSANVQGFVRSRVSRPGIYLLTDTGAGTVDQSIFIFIRSDGQDLLVYLHADIFPLGSSYIEYLAAQSDASTDLNKMEFWRKKKEEGDREPILFKVQKIIRDELLDKTTSCLAHAKKKLIVKEQLNDIRLIFSGGGHCNYPYEKAVVQSFGGCMFKERITPDIVGMPKPRDLELGIGNNSWLPRLNVAYGLSFERHNLAVFKYPQDTKDVKPEEIWQPKKQTFESPTKDEC